MSHRRKYLFYAAVLLFFKWDQSSTFPVQLLWAYYRQNKLSPTVMPHTILCWSSDLLRVSISLKNV